MKSLVRTFLDGLRRARRSGTIGDAMLDSAWTSFDINVGLEDDGPITVACKKGCAYCCSVRVTATGPEIFRVVNAIRSLPESEQSNIRQRIDDADEVTRGLGDDDRMKLAHPCPLLRNNLSCGIYEARPLGCRGLASFSKQACADAMSGKRDSIPMSETHIRYRVLIQAALQEALRRARLPFVQYELIHALKICLSAPDSERRWMQGGETIAAARDTAFSEEEVAAKMDEVVRELG